MGVDTGTHVLEGSMHYNNYNYIFTLQKRKFYKKTLTDLQTKKQNEGTFTHTVSDKSNQASISTWSSISQTEY